LLNYSSLVVVVVLLLTVMCVGTGAANRESLYCHAVLARRWWALQHVVRFESAPWCFVLQRMCKYTRNTCRTALSMHVADNTFACWHHRHASSASSASLLELLLNNGASNSSSGPPSNRKTFRASRPHTSPKAKQCYVALQSPPTQWWPVVVDALCIRKRFAYLIDRCVCICQTDIQSLITRLSIKSKVKSGAYYCWMRFMLVWWW
jgi:hypothetical protein